MKIFDGNYVRLDDDVSFQLVRTNPKLTTNTKLMYDGENLYIEAYPAEPLLSTIDYKHHKVWKTGLFNRDIRNFLLGTSTTSHSVGQNVEDTIVLNSFDNQFENMYWCGVESIDSDTYPQEMGCVAPLYIRKKRPNYFVIFKIDTPANTNMVNEQDDTYDFYTDVKERAKIVKAFDLREGTVIGDYIKKYVEQKNFEYDRSIYVNFSTNDIYYYGIDKNSGVLTQKVNNFEEQLLKNDNTITKMDDWITSGFERNGLIFPYIINFEFLFDDKDIDEYKFARYFGMYCNDIDLYDINVNKCEYDRNERSTFISTVWNPNDTGVYFDKENFYYIKDKKNNIHSVEENQISGYYKITGNVKKDVLGEFELSSVSTYMERVSGLGRSVMVFEVIGKVENNVSVIIKNKITTDIIGTFSVNSELSSREFYNNRFSNAGTKEDVAYAIAGVIRSYNEGEFKWITAFSSGNKVIIRSMYPGSGLNGLFSISFNTAAMLTNTFNIISDSFEGGTDIDGCLFKVYTSDKQMFFYNNGNEDDTEVDVDRFRYIKCGVGRDNAKIISFVPYIHDDNTVDDEYSIVVTDKYGPYVNISNTEFGEIIDRFYAKIGVLSFFPVKDFDFDTVSSQYGEYQLMKKELDKISSQYSDSDSDSDAEDIKLNIPYGKFFYHNGDTINTEYEYYFENIVPELSTVNKSVPFIVKWGYIDDSKDSCECPYRLNTSKIFDACNFSANTFMQRADVLEYTHSMPYYISGNHIGESNDDLKNEYQYIKPNENLLVPSNEENPETVLTTWINYFSRTKEDGNGDPFDELFGDTSRSYFNSKRFNKKYSRFLLGNTVNKSSTLFRGVKFEVTELKNGKEVNSGKYNDYRFSFIYIPVWNIKDDKFTVHFVKNDDYKFIVGFVLVDIKESPSEREFSKGYIYAGGMGYIDNKQVNN